MNSFRTLLTVPLKTTDERFTIYTDVSLNLRSDFKNIQ